MAVLKSQKVGELVWGFLAEGAQHLYTLEEPPLLGSTLWEGHGGVREDEDSHLANQIN